MVSVDFPCRIRVYYLSGSSMCLSARKLDWASVSRLFIGVPLWHECLITGCIIELNFQFHSALPEVGFAQSFWWPLERWSYLHRHTVSYLISINSEVIQYQRHFYHLGNSKGFRNYDLETWDKDQTKSSLCNRYLLTYLVVPFLLDLLAFN